MHNLIHPIPRLKMVPHGWGKIRSASQTLSATSTWEPAIADPPAAGPPAGGAGAARGWPPPAGAAPHEGGRAPGQGSRGPPLRACLGRARGRRRGDQAPGQSHRGHERGGHRQPCGAPDVGSHKTRGRGIMRRPAATRVPVAHGAWPPPSISRPHPRRRRGN